MAKRRKRTPLRAALGHGPARTGVHHWWLQRLTSVAMIPLGLWLIVSLILVDAQDHQAVLRWLGTPGTLVMMSLLLLALFHHLALGLQVIVEDYVHGRWSKLVLVVVIKLASVVLVTIALVAMLAVAFG